MPAIVSINIYTYHVNQNSPVPRGQGIPLVRTAEKSVLHIVSLFVCNLFLALGINLWFFLKKRSRTSFFLLLFYDFLVLVAMIGYVIAKIVIISATQNPG